LPKWHRIPSKSWNWIIAITLWQMSEYIHTQWNNYGYFNYLSHISPRTLFIIAQNCKKMQDLQIACCTQVTPKGFTTLCDHFPKLQHLNLTKTNTNDALVQMLASSVFAHNLRALSLRFLPLLLLIGFLHILRKKHKQRMSNHRGMHSRYIREHAEPLFVGSV